MTKTDAKVEQINAWIHKHNIHLRAMTEREAERTAKLYHAAIAVDRAEAELEDARREEIKIRASYCANPWHRSAPARMKRSCPEC
jgi:hypothetical protein